MKVALSILAVLAVVVSGANANLISNGGFDSAITTVTSGTVPTVAAATPNVWYTGLKGWDTSWGLDNGTLLYGTLGQRDKQTSQAIAMPGAGEYVYAFDYQTSARPSWGFGASVRLANATSSMWPTFFNASPLTGVATEVGVGTETFVTDGAWHTNSYTFTITPEQASSYTNLVAVFMGNGPGNLRIDNVSLTAVPEPATMSVLALGALGLIRRRR